MEMRIALFYWLFRKDWIKRMARLDLYSFFWPKIKIDVLSHFLTLSAWKWINGLESTSWFQKLFSSHRGFFICANQNDIVIYKVQLLYVNLCFTRSHVFPPDFSICVLLFNAAGVKGFTPKWPNILTTMRLLKRRL